MVSMFLNETHRARITTHERRVNQRCNQSMRILPERPWICLCSGFDDIKRHRQDAQFNNTKHKVYRDGATARTIASKDICVGDIVLVPNGGEIPCDLLLLVTSCREGVAYIQTANIDGEIDLKPRCVSGRRVCTRERKGCVRPNRDQKKTGPLPF